MESWLVESSSGLKSGAAAGGWIGDQGKARQVTQIFDQQAVLQPGRLRPDLAGGDIVAFDLFEALALETEDSQLGIGCRN